MADMKPQYRLRAGLVMAAVALAVAPALSGQAVEDFLAPLPGLSGTQLADFERGLDEFQHVYTADTGLGPIFNNTSCAACHTEGGIGGSSNITVTRFGRIADGRFDAMNDRGGSLLQQNAIDPSVREVVPAEATVVALRRSTPLFGLGLIEAIPDAAIINNALARKSPGVGGRAAFIIDAATGAERIGRFGWKAQHATLLAFAGDASVNELGITNRVFPHENAPNGNAALIAPWTSSGIEDDTDPASGKAGIDRLADFMRFLAPPPKPNFVNRAGAGQRWFAQVGCSECHVPSMTTGRSSIRALDRKPVGLYSDLLLHDMGSLGDGIAQGAAGPGELRTSPLWGLRVREKFLHDGRATTLEQAILLHDGEGAPSRELFLRDLSRVQQLELFEFLMVL